MTDNWLEEEFAQARARRSQVPDHARPVAVRSDLGLAVTNLLAALSGSQNMRGVSGCRRCTLSRPNGHGPCVACLAEDVASLINGGATNE